MSTNPYGHAPYFIIAEVTGAQEFSYFICILTTYGNNVDFDVTKFKKCCKTLVTLKDDRQK